jgi:hypothetical protein
MGPHKEDWGMGEDEDSRTRPGEKDYTGHEGDESKTKPGKKDYTQDEMADFLAKEARDGPHMLELIEEEGWELVEKDGHEEAEEVSEEEVKEQLGMRPSKAPHISVIRLTAAKNGLRKGNKG